MDPNAPKAGEILGDPKSPLAQAGDAMGNAASVMVAGQPPAHDNVSVVFLKNWKRWYATDKAGFPADLAAKLVDAKVAKYRKGAIKRAVTAVVERVIGGGDRPNAKDTIALVKACESMEELEALYAGEERKSVLAALAKRGGQIVDAAAKADAPTTVPEG